jgi:hypothetical protein
MRIRNNVRDILNEFQKSSGSLQLPRHFSTVKKKIIFPCKMGETKSKFLEYGLQCDEFIIKFDQS